MDELIFCERLQRCKSIIGETSYVEKTSYLEALHYSDAALNSFKTHKLSPADDFQNFLSRKGTFAPPELKDGDTFRGGTRLVLQNDIENKQTFSKDVISLENTAYESLMREMRLPLRSIQASRVVGPFFWWEYDLDAEDPCFQIIFRKSDVEWEKRLEPTSTTQDPSHKTNASQSKKNEAEVIKVESRGFEMMLSHSFRTRITSGYLKATDSKEFDAGFKQFRECVQKTSHPLLLPVLILAQQLDQENDEQQREIRRNIRRLEKALSRRYHDEVMSDENDATDLNKSGDKNSAKTGKKATEDPEEMPEEINWKLDKINCRLADLQCKAMWKRPQAWQKVVTRISNAIERFWNLLPEEEKVPELKKLNRELLCSLEFLAAKLEGLENYSHVSQERLNLQRQVMDSLMNLRESRISVIMAGQQGRLAEISRRDSTSMKTLALLGSLFLPGTFLSSIFSMSFFNFQSDMDGLVSSRLWIYFVTMAPLTAIIMGCWWMFDRHANKEVKEDEREVENREKDIEAQAMRKVRVRTGTQAF